MSKHDLIWGDSVAVRQAFLEQTRGISIQFGLTELEAMDYTPFNGDAKLIEETAKVILRHTGLKYDHIFLTNGATGACTIALRAYARSGSYVAVITNPAPYFPLYPGMAHAAGLKHVTEREKMERAWKSVILLDTPANPSGSIAEAPLWASGCPVIWDAVYHNPAYCSILVPPPEHEVMVGSFSKLTGLNGLRLGWIATNHPFLAERIGKLIAPEYCGLSKPSKMILTTLLDQFNNDPDYFWGAFEQAARYKLDCNRTEWAKLEKYFNGYSVSPNGMFHYAYLDNAAKALLAEANVLYQAGSKCGTDDSFGRFNIGQDPKVILSAVRAILKADKI